MRPTDNFEASQDAAELKKAMKGFGKGQVLSRSIPHVLPRTFPSVCVCLFHWVLVCFSLSLSLVYWSVCWSGFLFVVDHWTNLVRHISIDVWFDFSSVLNLRAGAVSIRALSVMTYVLTSTSHISSIPLIILHRSPRKLRKRRAEYTRDYREPRQEPTPPDSRQV